MATALQKHLWRCCRSIIYTTLIHITSHAKTTTTASNLHFYLSSEKLFLSNDLPQLPFLVINKAEEYLSYSLPLFQVTRAEARLPENMEKPQACCSRAAAADKQD